MAKKEIKALTPERIRKLSDAYFEKCRGVTVLKENGEVKSDKNGREIRTGERPPTLSGLAFALGLSSKNELSSFEPGGECAREIGRALLRVERYAEERLFDKDGLRGAEFSLRTNFGWQGENARKEDASCGSIVIPETVDEDDE